MHTNSLFSLHYLADTPYILPHGQLIADHARGIKINDTGVFIWNAINSGVNSMDKLVQKCTQHFEASPDEADEIAKDVQGFVDYLKAYNMVTDYKLDKGLHSTSCNSKEPPVPNNQHTSPTATTPGVYSAADNKNEHNALHNLNIAGIEINIYAPKGTFADEFLPFSSSAGGNDHPSTAYDSCHLASTDNNTSSAPAGNDDFQKSRITKLDTLNIFIHTGTPYPTAPSSSSTAVITNADLRIYRSGDRYEFFFPASDKLMYGYLTSDGHTAELFCKEPDEYDLSEDENVNIYDRLREMKMARNRPVSELSKEDIPTPRLKDDIFHAIRLLFLYTAHKNGMLMLHSASIFYKEKAWLFSASSGTGKSTHTNIWQKLFNTPIINGDLNLIGIEENIPVVKGTPWCGTSGIFDTETKKLGGIIMLKRADSDKTQELSPDEQRLLVLQRLISPAWDKKQIDESIKILDRVVDNILVCRLHCTKNDSAAVCMKNRIDSFLSNF